MISSFQAENFRLFDKLEINRLNRVNLIVGKNNAGKTALLEALLLFSSKMSCNVLFQILESRQEYWMPEQTHFAGQQLINPLGHLFKGHRIPALGEEGFKLSSNNRDAIHIRTGAYILEESENRRVRRRLKPEEIERSDVLPDELYLISESDESASIVMSLEDDLADLKRSANRWKRNNRRSAMPGLQQLDLFGDFFDFPRYQFVSARGISDRESSDLWDGISLTDLENEVLKGLRIIEPELLGLTFVKIDSGVKRSYQAAGRIPLVRQNKNSIPVPLKSLGDGMTRILHTVLSLVWATKGILLIDEFENGLHWEIQEKAWRVVFELAEKLNVQVFATTHSRDCVGSFSKVWQENPNKGAFIRLTKDHDKTTVTEYDTELLADSLEMNTEVR
uniref:ATPase/GTPase, AAA15 family n=1 Tax=Candidatus Kentrum sp. DK TaxID=2126562 RepID=A0A450S755_9GAMM|nr:MAG: ATPase/GTPase, AAA15 family [Candidatus Kentron sp. DK]